MHIPWASSGCGQKQHGRAPKNHKSVLSRPGFKFGETPAPEVGTVVFVHSSYFIEICIYCFQYKRCASFVGIECSWLEVIVF